MASAFFFSSLTVQGRIILVSLGKMRNGGCVCVVSTWPECLVLFPPSFHPQRLNKGTNVHPFLAIKAWTTSRKTKLKPFSAISQQLDQMVLSLDVNRDAHCLILTDSWCFLLIIHYFHWYVLLLYSFLSYRISKLKMNEEGDLSKEKEEGGDHQSEPVSRYLSLHSKGEKKTKGKKKQSSRQIAAGLAHALHQADTRKKKDNPFTLGIQPRSALHPYQ